MKSSLPTCFVHKLCNSIYHTLCVVGCLVGAATASADDGSFTFVEDTSVVEASHAQDSPASRNGDSFVFVEETSAPAQTVAPPKRGDIKLVSDISEEQAIYQEATQLEVSQSAISKPVRRQPTIKQPAANKIKVSKPAPLNAVGQLLVDAHFLSQTAGTTTDYSDVIDLGVEAIQLGAKGENKQYANQLISWALNRRGQLYSEEGKSDLADADFHEALKFDPKNWRALHNRGVSYAETGQFAEAFDDFNLVLEMNPEFGKAYTNRATLFVQAGDLSSAEQDYQQACRLDKKLSSARLGLARVCHIGGRWDEAYAHFTAAAELAPENPAILCSRGDLLADMGRYAEALADYADAIEIKPSFAHAYRNGAWLLATCPDETFRDSENAVLGARQALEFEYGDRHVALDTLAAALANAGNYDEAIQTLEEAIEVAPSASRGDYLARIKLYESGTPFRTQPVAVVSQAAYEGE
ncbi:tetratricopeptide repeat protein [Bythopirellula goksoeyrii]|uniref:Lipoprotein NlpI n=1 Tax=Bythopirellula goksoeyrii TaxID=1400387 RepID=A0A5B9Q2J7_9BACT|nr:tetratricopeptide repeat protein [Bythopirellula goksoeyrii]QEG33247.1 lipoprotein NlpI [Bythopirellula goksoeyrii]